MKQRKEKQRKLKKPKSWFFKDINKIEKPLAIWTKRKKKKEKLKLLKSEMKVDTLLLILQKKKRIIEKYYE